MDFYKIIIFIIFSFQIANSTISSKLVVDVVNSFEKAPKLLLRVCWTSGEKYNFLNNLNSSKSYKFIQFINCKNDDTKMLKTDQNNVLVVIDKNCTASEKFFKTACENKLFRPPLRWIIFTHDLSLDNIVPEDCNLSIDSEVTIVQKTQGTNYRAQFIYRLCRECNWQEEFYGDWRATNGFEKSKNFNQVTALRRKNLNGHEIKICYVLTNNDSIRHLNDRINEHIDSITKANYLTTNYLIDFMNGSHKHIFSETWGYRHNNTWPGMSGYLYRGEIDIGGTPMFFNNERLSFVEYITSPTPTVAKFVFLQPKLSYDNNLYLLPFKRSLWYGIGVLVVLLFFVISLVTVWERKKSKTTSEELNDDVNILRPNVIDIALFIFGAICQQGSPVELKGKQVISGALGRIVLLLLFGAIIFLYTSFTANIVALLQSSSSRIKTLEDLLNSRMKFAVEDRPYNRYYFSKETEPIRKAIYEKKVAPPGVKPNFLNVEDGVKAIRKGLFAFHMETGIGYKFVGKYFEESEKCGLKEISYLRETFPWLAVRKFTPYLDMFKIGTKRLKEHGLQQRENNIYYYKRPKCVGNQATFVSVNMVDFYPAIMILSIGILIAIVLVFIEIIHHKYKMKISNLQTILNRKAY